MALRAKTGLTSLPIWRDANQFLLAIEKVVKLFPKYHKYTLGGCPRTRIVTKITETL
ncbi:hypothetical protein MNBD_GAMMA04-2345 [hydrothermal vent metagenome]|uniref:Uncharacterized protein n=1 Tax=hydrothermal vent metagenome TaxID=652676 RepID=A0A3B1BA47_9ZZZZ